MGQKVYFSSDLSFERHFSCERQDEFVYHVLAKHLKKPGYFLDVACNHPKDASNTYVLEKYLNWDGIGFDIGDVEKDFNWSNERSSPFIQIDATSKMFTKVLEKHVGDRIVDYISLDVDWAEVNFSGKALEKILDANIKFKVMTLEHESFKPFIRDRVTKPTRELLHGLGYVMLFEDVSFPDGNAWEDWWINPALMPHKNILDIKAVGLTYDQCVEAVKNFGGV